ncbi:MAG: hypothetical protein HY669_04305 [Chloroflexi bacterium]|nr:hypothetical protein [Chloroflexota bacterium]
MEEAGIKWIAVVAGAVSLVVAYSFDWASIKGIPRLKQTIGSIAIVLHGYALYAASWGVASFSLPAPFFWIGLVFVPISLLLLSYSFFIEIPFARTYAKTGSGDQLVTTGTYALVRHPGVIWYSLFLISLFLATGSMTLLVAFPIWVLLDVLYVIIQERFFFDRMFPGYRAYRQQTPMLIPTRKSIARSFKTLNHRRSPND